MNRVGEVRPLPAVVLAYVCQHNTGSATYTLTVDEMQRAIDLLTPAEAAIHIPHPNLWSWRDLVEAADERSTFLAFFLGADRAAEGQYAAEFMERAGAK